MQLTKNKVVTLGLSTGLMFVSSMFSSATAAEFSSTVGGVLISSQDYIIGEDNDIQLAPYVSLEYGMFSLDENGLAVTYEIDEANAVSAALSQRESVFDRKDNKTLNHFDKRDSATELTINWMKSSGADNFLLAATGDVSNTHDGYQLTAGYSRNISALGGMLIPSIGVSLQSEDLVDYYYGVRSNESTANLASYKGKETVSAELAIAHVYNFSGNWSSFSSVSVEYLGSGIADSPIVKKDNVWTAVVGAVYEF
ncbi:MipA/OmpV family protein [Marinomonas sp. 15G1-11]|uniref:MipA/OmpV family protein n=1 Tax=Marinomonas phaeophyticola TaxID=3004091 RepID=A0ABT4JWY6_9GAMM|nr:MipA/OmpV family protein [Marinomonas sp. 15G1-11]MCZ2722916.1 MipA/OmpV family protein [Marinomonas sp. 15G1-11]